MDIEKYIINYSLKQNNYKQSFLRFSEERRQICLKSQKINSYNVICKYNIFLFWDHCIAEGIKIKARILSEYKRIIREANEK